MVFKNKHFGIGKKCFSSGGCSHQKRKTGQVKRNTCSVCGRQVANFGQHAVIAVWTTK